MGDRFFHPDSKKAQDIELRGGKLIRKTKSEPSVAQSVAERNRKLEEAYGASGGTAGKRGQKGSGVSGYKTPKGEVKRGLNEAGGESSVGSGSAGAMGAAASEAEERKEY